VRVDDRPVPAVVGEHPEPRWPADLFVAIDRLPSYAYRWDDYVATWDDPPERFLWDDAFTQVGLTDATCDIRGLEIEVGSPDPEGLLDSGHVTLTLANDVGQWSQYDPNGLLRDYAPGQRLEIWAVVDGEAWWLFSGRVTDWRERADNTVEVEAFDWLSEWNRRPTAEWTPGTHDQTPDQRIAAIVALFNLPNDGLRLEATTTGMHNAATTATPLEEMQAVAVSDGGVLGVDADGQTVYRGRSFLAERDDQDVVPVVPDTERNADAVIWDLALTTDDDGIVNTVELTNVAGTVVTADNDWSVTAHGEAYYSRTGDQWVDSTDGADLATFLAARRANAYVRVDEFTLHLHDPRQDL